MIGCHAFHKYTTSYNQSISTMSPKDKTKNKTKNNGNSKKPSVPVKANTALVISNPRVRSGLNLSSPYQQSAISKICSLTDPFCGHALGARWPDGSANLFPFTVRGHTVMTTMSNGGAYTQVNTGFPYNTLSTSSFAVNYTMAAAFTGPSTGSANTYFAQARPVLCGLVLRSLLPVSTTQGYLIIRQTPQDTVGPSGVVVPGNCYGAQVWTYPIAPNMEIPLVFNPVQGTGAYDVIDQSTTTSIPTSWNSFSIEIIGSAASTNVIDIDYFFHYEGAFQASYQSLSGISNSHASDKPEVRAMVRQVSDKLTNSLTSSVMSFGERAVKFAATAVATRFLGPAAGRATNSAMAMLVD